MSAEKYSHMVERFIELKEKEKDVKEELHAIQMVLFSIEDELKEDKRISFVHGRKTTTIAPHTYKRLEELGIETEVVEYRKKNLEEFDVDIRDIIVSNPDNVIEKQTRGYVKINKKEIKK
jgi:hypothetical protein